MQKRSVGLRIVLLFVICLMSLSFSSNLLSSNIFIPKTAEGGAPSAPPVTDYYLIAVGTNPGDSINPNDDTDSGGTLCTLRDALNIVNASTTSGPVSGCAITLIGVAPANPVYVINLPTGSYTFTLTDPFSGGLGELDINSNEVYVVGDSPSNSIIQAFATPAQANRSMRVFNIFGAIVEFSNLTIRHGTFSGSFLGEGAGIYSNRSTLTLDNVQVSDNYARGHGAGIYFNNSSANPQSLNILNGSLVTNNQAGQLNFDISYDGGGAYVRALTTLTTVNVDNSSITNNISVSDAGGIYLTGDGLVAEITNSLFDGNSATNITGINNGGGLYNASGTVNIRNSVFTNNSTDAGGGADEGGAIANRSGGTVNILQGSQIGTNGNPNISANGAGVANASYFLTTTQLIVDSSSIGFNQASRTGGGIYNEDYAEIRNSTVINENQGSLGGGGIANDGASGVVIVIDSTIRDNTASLAFLGGGGILNNSGGEMTFTNTRIDNNTARAGGGITNAGLDAQITLDNSTVVNNDATNGGGGGIANYAGGTVTIQNGSVIGSIAEFNTANSGGGIYNTGIHESSGISLARSTVIITDSFVQGNLANLNIGSTGGGIANTDRAELRITNSQITDNQANGNGGGIYSDTLDTDFYPDGSLMFIDNSLINSNISISRSGGGIYHFNNGDITVQNGSSINNNNSALDGGGLYASHFGIGQWTTDIDILDSQILGNGASQDGGGIYIGHGYQKTNNILIDNSQIGSVAQPNTAQNGGGIYHNVTGGDSSSTITLQNGASIIGNQSNVDGGAIYNTSEFNGLNIVNLNAVSLTDNQAISGNGGAIYNFSDTNAQSNINLNSGTIVQNNIAGTNGGAIYNDAIFSIGSAGGNATITADYVLFELNSATGNGGAVFNTQGSGGNSNINIVNSSLRTNSAVNGGAIYHEDGTTLINNSCINDNGEGVRNVASTIQNATGNWWGTLDGPSDLDGLSGASGTGDGVTQFVNFDGFLSGPFDSVLCLPNDPYYDSTPVPGGTLVINTIIDNPDTGSILVINRGGVPLDITALSLTEIAPEINLLTNGPITLNTSETASLDLSCQSSELGTYTDTLTVIHTASGSPAVYTIICNVTELVENTTLTKAGTWSDAGIGILGNQITWTIVVTNPSANSMNDIVVSDSIASYLQIENVTTTHGSVSINGQNITINIATLNGNTSATIEIVTTLIAEPIDGIATNTVTTSTNGQTASATAKVNVITSLPNTGYPPNDD